MSADNLDIEIYGLKALSGFSFKKNNREYKTLIVQEMLNKGFLASTNCSTSVATLSITSLTSLPDPEVW